MPISDKSIPNTSQSVCSNNASEFRDGVSSEENEEEARSYWSLIQGNRPFRYYLGSYLLGHTGEWLTYVASIALIEEIQGESVSRTAISLLVIIRLMPNVLFAPFGGALADSRDRRESMIVLELLGAFFALLFLLAYVTKSIQALYLVTFLQQTNAAIFEPCRSSIVPLLVKDEEYLKKATTLTGLSWSLMAAIGAALGGFVVASFGIRFCFLLDCGTFLGSAFLMYMVGGKWTAVDTSTETYDTMWQQVKEMTINVFSYLRGSFFGSLIFLKASVAIIYGASDVLNVAFSERGSTNSSEKLGLLFSLVGVGCIIGPLICDKYTSMDRLSTLQQASIISIFAAAIGCLGMGLFHPFFFTCLFTMVRSGGASAVWINSSILLQRFADPEKLGRVLSIDYALALLCESVCALASGLLMDRFHAEPEEVSLVMAGVGGFLTICWVLYHISGGGAARAGIEHTSKSVVPKQCLPHETTLFANEETALLSVKNERAHVSNT